jgi:regulator of ribonuclease activity A
MTSKYRTTDLCDQYENQVSIAEPIFRDYGGVESFSGRIATVRVLNDNVLVSKALAEPGDGRVLVVDGDGSLRCALLGDRLASMAHANGWAGVIVHGCVRDTSELAQIVIGIKALASHPKRSGKQGLGERDTPVTFAGVTFTPGQYVYADADGVIVAEEEIGG